ncbi:MAG: PAS domain S-box protein [Actinomycetota bacterium]|nr:PAS domain S-box protein [Actinomycetota bacterium]
MDIEKITREQLINKLVEMNQEIIDLKEYKKQSINFKELLEEAEGKYKSLLNTSSVGIIMIDSRGIITECNDAVLEFSGYSRGELVGRYFTKRVNISTRNITKYLEVFKAIIDGKEVNAFEIMQHKKNGDVLYGEVYFGPLRNNNNRIVGFKIIIKDITEEKKFEIGYLENKNKFKTLFKSSAEGILIHDNGKILDANDAFIDMFGYNRLEDVTGRNLGEFIDTAYRETVMDRIRTGCNDSYEVIGVRSTGSRIFVEISGNSIIYYGGRARIEIFNNINERKKAERRIKYLTFHDKLTELYNRTYFEKVLINIYKDRDIPLSFIICDLNGLKLVNDAFGYNEGDRLLKRMAKILKYCSREGDIIARWGEDEFFILLPRSTENDTKEVLSRIMKICSKTKDQKIPLNISVGVSIRENQSQSLREVIKEAENNMYKNKLLKRKSIYNSIILSLERILWEKNRETKEHAERLRGLALQLGSAINLPQNKLDELELLSALHDIGKVGIPDAILMKKGKLNAREWKIIKRHPEIGYRIAESTPQIAPIADDILAHHEWWDGSGYPQGLKGSEIPVNAAITSIIDAYDVMTFGRHYKEAISEKEALQELISCSGTQFNPFLVEKFIMYRQKLN